MLLTTPLRMFGRHLRPLSKKYVPTNKLIMFIVIRKLNIHIFVSLIER